MLLFPDHPNCTTEQLRQDVKDHLRDLAPSIVEDAEIGTTETAVAHGLGETPTCVRVTPKSGVLWWMPRDPDAIAVYLQASAPVHVRVETSRG